MKQAGPIPTDIIATSTIERVNETDISADMHRQIHELLSRCFPGYPKGKSYYKQLPHFRLLMKNNSKLIGHIAIDHRLVCVGNEAHKIFGIADLCIDENFQSNNLASQLLTYLEQLAERSGIDFILLFTNEQSFYKKNKFSIVTNVCRWVFISDNRTLGISQRKLGKSIMIKPISNKKWGDEVLDLMGHIF